jgi:Mg2+ and Co2+ transporter CorA
MVIGWCTPLNKFGEARCERRGSPLKAVSMDEPTDCKGKSEFVWIGLFEPSERELEHLEKNYGLHPLAIEDALKANQMPKVDVYGDQLFIMTRTAHLEHDHIAYGETAIFVQLAAWAAILAVPTAIAGIYGMNFENMPELKTQ